jgi:hypothetical protein
MNAKTIFSVLSFVLLVVVNNSWAANASVSKSKVIAPINQSLSASQRVVAPVEEKFSGNVSFAYSGNSYEENDPGASRSYGIESTLSYKLSEFWSVTSIIGGEKELVGRQEIHMSNTPIKLSYKRFVLLDVFKVENRLTATLPTNDEIARDTSYRGGVNLGSDFKHEFKAIPVDFVYGFGVTRNLHGYELDREGSPNIEYSIIHSIALVGHLGKKVNLLGAMSVKNGKTYVGAEKTTFLGKAGVEVEVTKSFSAGVEINNEGDALKADGRESNISLYNENTTVLGAGLSYNF